MNRCEFLFLFLLLWLNSALAFDDPTRGKAFFPWLWEDQFKPTIYSSASPVGLTILGTGVVTTIAAHQYDGDVERHNLKNENLLMDRKTSSDFATIGSGALGVGIALAQLVWDQENGLMHTRALTLTTLSHVTLAYAIQRKRPDARGDFLPFPSSFPSGHASSAFASAGSLAYAYGWKIGIPAYLIATGISVARISENSHWVSDVTSGISLGVYWAYASYKADQRKQPMVEWMPIPLDDGMALVISYQF
jgi:membrane-associated phospholipid phosphatase